MKDLLAANQAFFKAFEALDVEAMTAVWLGSKNDICVHPGWEILRGWFEIRESWRAIFANTGYMRFHPSDLSYNVHNDQAVITCVENIYSVIQGKTIQTRVACTNIFVRRDGRWRLVLHHGSPIASRQSARPVPPDEDLN